MFYPFITKIGTFFETTFRYSSRSITTHFFGFPGASGYLYDIKPNEVNSISISGGTPLAHALEELQGEMKRGSLLAKAEIIFYSY